MLVLTRRASESILIGDDIKVTVLAVTAGGVRIGIDAPRDKRINREEIVIAISDENQVAARATNGDTAEAVLLSALGLMPSADSSTTPPSAELSDPVQ